MEKQITQTLFITELSNLTPDQKRMVNEAFPLLTKRLEQLERDNFKLENEATELRKSVHNSKAYIQAFRETNAGQERKIELLEQRIKEQNTYIETVQLTWHSLGKLLGK